MSAAAVGAASAGPAAGVLALARTEASRLLRHPILLAGAALSLLFLQSDLGEYGGRFFLLTIGGLLPLAAAILAAANLATLRSRRSDTDELWASVPAGASSRTLAHLLSLVAPLALASAILAAAHVWFDAGGGLRVDVGGTAVVPSAAELAQGPLVVLALGAAGVALARWVPAVVVAPVLVVAFLAVEMPLASWGSASEWRWLAPAVNHGTDGWAPCSHVGHLEWGCDRAGEFEVATLRWHLVYLAGLTALFASLALARDRPRPGALATGVGGLAVAASAAVAQVA